MDRSFASFHDSFDKTVRLFTDSVTWVEEMAPNRTRIHFVGGGDVIVAEGFQTVSAEIFARSDES